MSEITIDKVVSGADVEVFFLGFGADGDSVMPKLALKAVPEPNWFGATWHLRLTADTDLFGREPVSINLRNGQSQPFLHDGHTYRTMASYDPGTREMSFALWDLTASKEVYAGFFYLSVNPHLSCSLTGVGGSTNAIADKQITLQSMSSEQRYTRLGSAVPLREATVVMLEDKSQLFTGALNWSDGNLGFRITRPFGRLPGEYKAFLEDGAKGQELFTTSAEPLEAIISLGQRILSPGQHSIRIAYVQPANAAPNNLYVEEIRTLTLDVIAPKVQPSVRIPMQEALFNPKSSVLSGEVVLSLNQPLENVQIALRTPAGTVLLEQKVWRRYGIVAAHRSSLSS